MSDFSNGPDEVLARLTRLADKTCRELQLAGIPAYRRDNSPRRAGAEVSVDAGDDPAGGVFVNWNPDPELFRAAVDSFDKLDFSAPVIQHRGAVSSYMRDAIIGILRSAGMRAEVADEDMRPTGVQVIGE